MLCARGRQRATPLPNLLFSCKGCGKETLGVLGKKFCTKACQWSHYWEKGGGRLRSREHVNRHRAQKLRTQVEPIDCLDLFKRDGWICQLCRQKIDPALRHPHRRSATVDHIVPLSKGGSHTWDNVQSAHFGCNSSKGAKVYGQFRLKLDTSSNSVATNA